MSPRIAIIGSGPTGLYTLAHLSDASRPLDITLFEAQPEAGWGMPYAPDLNGATLLANIASVEIPPLCETLVAWLARIEDNERARLGVVTISDRAFYPRVVLGEYFRAQLAALLVRASARGHRVEVRAARPVSDIELRADDILVSTHEGAGLLQDGAPARLAFDHVVLATGHAFPDATEGAPGYFTSPYPTAALATVPPGAVGIRGTSLSAIDAAVAVAGHHGVFLRDAGGVLIYHPRPGTDGLHITLMSRKGLLPEADFYFPIPYDTNVVCTPAAVDALIAARHPDLLDATFALFREELVLADPDYAARIGLSGLDADSFAPAYFRERTGRAPFVAAAENLAEAKANYAAEIIVLWRYAILRMHEVVERIVPHLSPVDLKRFQSGLKGMFVDDYATVPHESIERLIALARADRLDVLALGRDHGIVPAGQPGGPQAGAVLTLSGREHVFAAFIEAVGQGSLSAADLPFPSLHRQGALHPVFPVAHGLMDADGAQVVDQAPPARAEGIDLDDDFRLCHGQPLRSEMYCLALPFLLHRLPFHQGITSSQEMAATVAAAILATARAEQGWEEKDRSASGAGQENGAVPHHGFAGLGEGSSSAAPSFPPMAPCAAFAGTGVTPGGLLLP